VRIGAAALLVLVLGAAGCSSGETATTTHTPAATQKAPEAGPVADEAWRAVIDDWYVDGVLDDRHSCAAVRAAIERVPRSGPSSLTAFEDLRRDERRRCG
jgi:hypothetical protein